MKRCVFIDWSFYIRFHSRFYENTRRSPELLSIWDYIFCMFQFVPFHWCGHLLKVILLKSAVFAQLFSYSSYFCFQDEHAHILSFAFYHVWQARSKYYLFLHIYILPNCFKFLTSSKSTGLRNSLKDRSFHISTIRMLKTFFSIFNKQTWNMLL
jgi:hypothetical protein